MHRAPLFRGLDGLACSELVRLARERRVVRRESFFLQGDPASDIFILCAGRIKTTQVGSSGEQVILRLVGPGEAFGALEGEIGSVYPSGAEALQASHALLWDRGAFDVVANSHPVVLRNVLRIVSERLRALEQSCRELATVRASVRVASALSRLAAQMAQPADGGALVSLGREDLAQMTGTTPFTVSRLLADWEARGYLRSRREAILLMDGPGLARHVASDSRRPLPASASSSSSA
ncbi:MAG: Crp/Fnr family transcriptional regulator [Vicinamibacteria bacterium]